VKEINTASLKDGLLRLKEKGDKAQGISDYRKASEYYTSALKALKRVEGVNLRELEFDLLLKLGKVNDLLGDAHKAMENFQLSLGLGEFVYGQPLYPELLRQMGRLYARKGEREKAIRFLSRSIRAFKQRGNLKGMADGYLSLGNISFERGDWKEVVEFFNLALQIGERMDDFKLMAHIYNNFGAMFNIQGDWEGAITYYRKSGGLYRRIKDDFGLARTFHNIGMTFVDQTDYRKADYYFNQSLRISEAKGIASLMATTYLSKAEVFVKFSRLKEARKFCDKATKHFEKLEDELGVAEAEKLKGAIYREGKKWSLAEEHLRRSAEINRRAQCPLGLAEAYRELALIYRRKGENRKALSLLGETIELFRALGAEKDLEEVSKTVSQIEELYLRIVQSMGARVEQKDPYTLGHSARVAQYSLRIAQKLGLSWEKVKGILTAAYLHDLGKIHIKASILKKPAKLTPEEYEEIKLHPAKALEVLQGVKFPWGVEEIILHHHERWDGRGYPEGLKGEEIPLGGRIIAVADSFDAMTTTRPYRPAFSKREALDEIEEKMGIMYDPKVAKAFLEAMEEEGEGKVDYTFDSVWGDSRQRLSP